MSLLVDYSDIGLGCVTITAFGPIIIYSSSVNSSTVLVDNKYLVNLLFPNRSHLMNMSPRINCPARLESLF